MQKILLIVCLSLLIPGRAMSRAEGQKARVIVTSDGEIDDECSLVRFLLYSNEWKTEAIITSSSQYHWHGHRWAGDDWLDPYLEAYAEVYPNLLRHSKDYPTPEYLKSVSFLGNVEAEGEMDSVTAGSRHIVKVLLDKSDERPVWLLAWGGTNTIARALKTIEEDHPQQMESVAAKLRFFFIWEQDSTYQAYIEPHWGKYNISTIISDQFWAMAYQWDKVMPPGKREYFESDWMKANILEDHGALCSLYQAHEENDKRGWKAGAVKPRWAFRSEGDSPAFIHLIETGLRNMESPAYGGWAGRYVNVRGNTWLDPVPESGYIYPEGRWFTGTAWGRKYMRSVFPDQADLMRAYFKPITRWADALQNDFAARADWCTEAYEGANHPPVVTLGQAKNITTRPGREIWLDVRGTTDPDGDELRYFWWQHEEAGSYSGQVQIVGADKMKATFVVPGEIKEEVTIHLICSVTDNGSPQLTRYRRVIVTVSP